MKKAIIKVLIITLLSFLAAFVFHSNYNYSYNDIYFVLGIVLLIVGVMTIAYEPNRVSSFRGSTASSAGLGNNVDLLFHEAENKNNGRIVGKFSAFNVIFLLPALLMFLLSYIF